MRYLFTFAILVLFFNSACSQNDSTAVESERIADRVPKKNLQTIIKEKNIPKTELLILIDKSAYTLSVMHKEEMLITYPCVFGFNAIDDKRQEGDGCTPEGSFGIRSKYAHSSWKYFIWFDYPTKESWSKHKKSKADCDIPNSATVGGELGIHGVPEGADGRIADKTNWTLGCISLTNKDIEDLYKSTVNSTKILIVK